MEIEEIQEHARIVEEGLSITASEMTQTYGESAKNNLVPTEEVDCTEADGSQKLTEEEIDDFIMKEQIAASEGNNANIDSKYTL